ncbi:MAG: tRNA1(Val) (adenine(37)-N6)-methyltransferase [Erysipelotrichaceae bacterium]
MSDYLKYINYSFSQNDNVFHVSTDTTVLGMFLDELYKKTVMDIGTGSGALLLYAHYKKAGKLIGVDIQDEALKLAKENIGRYTDNFELIKADINELEHEKVDVVICNPPFFEVGSVRESDAWNKAMFESELSLDDMFKAFRKFMKENGTVYTLYPAERFNEFYEMCLKYKLKIMRLQFVHDLNRPYAMRIVAKLKIGKMNKLKVEKPIMISRGEIVEKGF